MSTETVTAEQLDTPDQVRSAVRAFIDEHWDPSVSLKDWLGRLADSGWAVPQWPAQWFGKGLTNDLAAVAYDEFKKVNAVGPPPGLSRMLAAPTIISHGTDEQRTAYIRRILVGEDAWCQLFSEPGAGSDLAALQTRAELDGDEYVVNGQKVWTSGAHKAQMAILVARTNPDVAKHAGLSYFLCDMTAPGVDVRPLRQITGEAEFNEVFLTDVHIPDSQRLGDEGQGWKVATATLNNERVAIGGGAAGRESGMVGVLSRTWREHPERRGAGQHDKLMRLWVDAEVARVTGQRLRQKLAAGEPGPEGSAMKLTFARIAQEASGMELELLGDEGLRFSDWTMRRPQHVDFTGRDAGYRYLRAKGNSIEGGTSEILRNVIAERVLGLPSEPRVDTGIPWKDLPR